MNAWTSHLELLKQPYCHITNSQFEHQWQNSSQPFYDHDLEMKISYLCSLHMPSSHSAYLPRLFNSPQERPSFHPIIRLRNSEDISHHLEEWLADSKPLYFWGFSPQAIAWANTHKKKIASYPSLECIQMIHNKRWIEQLRGPLDLNLSIISWITHKDQLEQAIKLYPMQTWMIKRAMHAAGRGNYLLPKGSIIPRTLIRWLDWDGGLLLQPFLERIVDFSSLWYISFEGSICKLGLTRMIVNNQGHYQGCILGEQNSLFGDYLELLEVHFTQAYQILKKSHQEGYFGFIGLDAFIYKTSSKALSTTVIEINARQTLAMHLESIRRTFLPQTLAIANITQTKQKNSLLPNDLGWNISLEAFKF
jgi:hypothetical protein